MNAEELFRKLFPEYCRGEECLSPYFDLFQAGINEATKELRSCDTCKHYKLVPAYQQKECCKSGPCEWEYYKL